MNTAPCSSSTGTSVAEPDAFTVVYFCFFSSKPVIHVYAKALAAYQKSKWAEFGTLVGDLDDYTPVETVNRDVLQSAEDAPVYDLMGRRVTRLQPGTIYIRKGKKFMAK